MRRALIGAGLCGAALALVRGTRAQPGPMLRRASESVLKIETGSSVATGFVWPDATHVVTALHVIDAARDRIVAHSVDAQGRITQSVQCSVERVLKASDLVLLRLPGGSRAPFSLNANPPAIKQSLDALGFPLNVPSASSIELKIRHGGTQLRSIVPPKVQHLFTDYPSLNSEILNLEGNLVPGMSGAPILDADGRVVGVANGGLEEGAVGLCWGIPAAHLNQLAQSVDATLPRGARVAQLFSADLRADVRALPPIAGVKLTKLRSRTYQQLAATADDQLGLAQLTSLFQMFNPGNFGYDIYQDLASGATVAVPEGAKLAPRGNDLIHVSVGDPQMSMVMQVRAARDEADAQAQSVEFERLLTGYGTPGVMLSPDPAWTYLQPLRRGSLLVARKAAMRAQLVAGQWMPTQYFFETVATNGRAFLGIGAINADATPATMAIESACGQGFAHPRCQQLVASRRTWAQMVLGAQFSTFAGG